MPAELLAEIDVVERIVGSAVDTEFSDLSGFLLFSYSFLFGLSSLALFRFISLSSRVANELV